MGVSTEWVHVALMYKIVVIESSHQLGVCVALKGSLTGRGIIVAPMQLR